MTDRIVPDAALDVVAVRAVVWEIMRVTGVTSSHKDESSEDAAKKIANTYIKVFQAVYHSEPISTELNEVSK